MKVLSALCLVCFCPIAALAQTAPSAPPAARPGEPVDTSALAYYASKHDTQRMDAEMRRLRSLYPSWQPPADPASLTVAPTGPSEDQPLWDLFGTDKLDELEAEIARHKAANPAWAPPPELVAKLAAKRARTEIVAASDRKDYPAVVNIAAKSPDLMTPDDLDLSWRLADAYGQTGASEKALKVDQFILEHTQDPTARLATVRKAMVLLTPLDLDKLMAAGHVNPEGHSEFDPVSLDLVRQRVGRALAPNTTETAAPQDLARLQASAQSPGGAIDAALLGWWYSKRQDWSQANSWFQIALKAAPTPAQAKPDDAKVAQGSVLALKALDRRSDAETLAYSWREADPALALLYIASVESDLARPKPVAIDQDRLKRFSDVVIEQQSGDGAQALGWYAYNVGQPRPAEAWFRKAMAWQPRDTTALGLALSLKENGDKPAFAAFLKDNGPTFPALAALSAGTAVPMQAPAPAAQGATAEARRPNVVQVARAAVHHGTPRATAGRAPKSSCSGTPGQVGAAAALQAGWCLMSLNRPQEAAMAFAAARAAPTTRADASYGEALAALRSNRTDAAIMAAGSGDLTPQRRNEIGVTALAQKASTAFDEGRYKDTLQALDERRMYVPEPRDLAILRAWSIYHTDRREQAQTLFTTLDTQLSTKETRTGMAATAQPSRY